MDGDGNGRIGVRKGCVGYGVGAYSCPDNPNFIFFVVAVLGLVATFAVGILS